MFEAALGALEGGFATSFASGLAATAAALDLVPSGGTVVTQSHAYYGTLTLLRRYEEQKRLTVRLADLTDTAVIAAAVEAADLVWVESPTNPMLRVVDLPALVTAARAAGALSVIDNTFATPILQRPLTEGADVVIHSATKFLSGHADVLLGAVVTSDKALAQRVVSHRSTAGSVPGTLEAWLALRGLRTLHVRVRAAQANAQELVRRLREHAAVVSVHYPGSGAMLSFEVRGGADAADAVADGTTLWVSATSLGGVESSLERRRRWSGESTDVPENLLRCSVGIEDVDDLWRDLSRALAGG
jgi:cystathionine gamma-synthase